LVINQNYVKMHGQQNIKYNYILCNIYNNIYTIYIMYYIFFIYFLRVVDRAFRYIHVIKTNLMHYLSSVYFVNQPLYVSGVFVAHHQEVYCILYI
jgi:hypothetical protein